MAVQSIQLKPRGANLFSTGQPALYLENGTNIPYSGYGFDASTSEQVFFDFKVPFYLSGNLTVTIRGYSQTGQTTGAVIMGVQMAALSAGDAQSVLTDALATAQVSSATTINGTARGSTEVVVTVTNLDSLAADDTVQMRIYRDAAAGGDNLTGDFIVFDVEVEYAATGGVGAGNVSNAGASTDNAIARFDLATGQVIQNSVVTIADSTGDMAGVGLVNELTPRFIGFARLTSAFTSSGTGVQTITGTSISFPSAGTYLVEFDIVWQVSTTSAAMSFGILATGGTISPFAAFGSRFQSATTLSAGSTTTNGAQINATSGATATTDAPARYCATFVATAAGTVVLQCQKATSGTITTQIGSYGKLFKIA